ncbi:MAG: hypothetical protein HYR91_11845 [Flavobacteriia bacterium]|nr:hypothetical protein [Flavobacteriia bacterium]
MLKRSIIALSLLISGISYSQDAQVKTSQERAKANTEKLNYELGLTPEQKVKVQAVNEGIAYKNDEIRKNPNMSAEQKEAAIKGNNQARLTHLKSILTEEQYNKLLNIETKKSEEELHQSKMNKTSNEQL